MKFLIFKKKIENLEKKIFFGKLKNRKAIDLWKFWFLKKNWKSWKKKIRPKMKNRKAIDLWNFSFLKKKIENLEKKNFLEKWEIGRL